MTGMIRLTGILPECPLPVQIFPIPSGVQNYNGVVNPLYIPNFPVISSTSASTVLGNYMAVED